MVARNRLIILNGTSSAGKSSIAKAIQAIDTSYLHIQLDMFLHMLSPKMLEDAGAFDKMNRSLCAPISALLDEGYDIVFDTVAIGRDFKNMVERLQSYTPFYVGVMAPLAVVCQREIARDDRQIGLAQSQYCVVHPDVDYDFKLDTSIMTPSEAAQIILDRYAAA